MKFWWCETSYSGGAIDSQPHYFLINLVSKTVNLFVFEDKACKMSENLIFSKIISWELHLDPWIWSLL